jgi:leucyl/phenylalanyl-tRNA--protein transferase
VPEFPRLEWDFWYEFPDPRTADEDGLVGAGGNLSPGMLLSAYRQGLFPWFSRDGAPYWFSPDPRFILIPSELHVGETLRKVLRRQIYVVTYDRAFADVMSACAESPRPNQPGTWITADFLEGYGELHRLGFAHSVEVWHGKNLVGGLYGLLLGKIFFGESMFSREDNASKVGFVTLVRHLVETRGLELIDCQAPTAYLASFGAKEVSREWFLGRLRALAEFPGQRGPL